MEYDIVILGSGVAGLSAGIYASRANNSVLIIENGNMGGTTATLLDIQNYPGFEKISGMDLVEKMFRQAVALGVNVLTAETQSINFSDKNILLSDGQNVAYKALIIATGNTNIKLGVPGEEEYKMRGVSYCAVCDGTLYKDKEVVLITNNALGKTDVDYLRSLTNKLTVLNISDGDIYDDLKNYKNVIIKSILGDIKANSITFDSDGHTYSLDVNGIFVDLGKKTDLHLFDNDIKISNEHIETDDNMRTNIPGVFAAGDIRDKSLRQIVTACSDGAIAGAEAIKYLNSL